MKKIQDIVIVGAGIAGASVAYHLAKKGVKNITIIEAYKAGGLYSIVSAAMLMHQNGIRKLTELAKYSIQSYKNFKEKTGYNIDYNETGSLLFSTTSKGAKTLKKYVSSMTSVGIKASYLTKPQDIAKKAKILNVTGIKAASYCESDGYVDASKVMKFYFREAQKMRVKIIEKTKVIKVLKKDNMVIGVKTDSGKTIYTKILIDCAGCYSKDLGKLAGVNIPIKSSKRDLAVTKPLKFINYKFPILEHLEEGWYFRPFRKFFINLVLVGVAPSKWIEDKDRKFHPKFNWEGISAAKKYMSTYLPNLNPFLFINGRSGYRPMLETSVSDGLPIIGESKTVKGYFASTAWGEWGITLGAIGGKLISQIILGQKTTIDTKSFSPSRFES
ncbi:MAG: FAD-dependent oxidoreductase [Patescibacteria group bacterium]|jgi:sarcosine oxidase subunit beta